MEVLLGKPAPAPEDESGKTRALGEAERAGRRTAVADAGGKLLTAAFAFLGQVLPKAPARNDGDVMSKAIVEALGDCVSEGADGRIQVTVSLPGKQALDELAGALAAVLRNSGAGGS